MLGSVALSSRALLGLGLEPRLLDLGRRRRRRKEEEEKEEE